VFVLEGRAAPVSGDDEAVLVLSMIDEIGFPAIRIEGSELLVITAASDQIRVVLGDDAVLVPRSAPLFERRVRALAIAVGAGARGAVERVIEARRRRLA